MFWMDEEYEEFFCHTCFSHNCICHLDDIEEDLGTCQGCGSYGVLGRQCKRYEYCGEYM